jgi:hypothetical protein
MPHCIVLLVVSYLNSNFKIKFKSICKTFIFPLLFLFGPAHFSFPFPFSFLPMRPGPRPPLPLPLLPLLFPTWPSPSGLLFSPSSPAHGPTAAPQPNPSRVLPLSFPLSHRQAGPAYQALLPPPAPDPDSNLSPARPRRNPPQARTLGAAAAPI